MSKYRNEHRGAILELIGQRGEKAFRILWDIAEGRASYKKLAREPSPDETSVQKAMIPVVEVVPTFKEREDALMFLIEHAFGKAKVDVNIHTDPDEEGDLSALSDDEIAELKSLLKKTGRVPASLEEVEGEIVEPPALPPPDEIPPPRVMSLHEAALEDETTGGPMVEIYEQVMGRDLDDQLLDLFGRK